MFPSIFRILILFALVCSIGPWRGPGITDTVVREQVNAAPLEQKADKVLPLDAQTTISADIGQSETGYHFVATDDGYTVRTTASGMGVYLSADSVQIEAGDLTWDLHLQGWGYSSIKTLDESAELAVVKNRAEYRYPGLIEWYVNGPFGLQQGFTIAVAPANGQDSQLTLALNLGELRAQVDGNRKGVVVSGSSASTKLDYGGLKAYDATGHPLAAWMETSENAQALLLQVETAGAVYPITVDPLARQIKLTASQAAGENFGFSVAVSGDGRTALVGAYAANDDTNLAQGAAYVFYLDKIYGVGGNPTVFEWVYQARLEFGAAGDRLGISVALSNDGNVALIGADQVDWGPDTNQGAAHVYTRSSGTWTRQSWLVAEDGAANDKFGWSVALNAAGDTALVGAHGADVTFNGITTYTDNGTAYVFTSNAAGVWSQQAKLDLVVGDDGALGYSVALDDAGDTALLGAFGYDAMTRTDEGLAVVYQRSGTTWTAQDAFVPATPVAGGLFGRSVALSASGAVALIGASGTMVGTNVHQGAAYIFTPSGNTWSEKAMLTASDGAAEDAFGVSVALDGANAYVGAYKADVSGRVNQGAVYRFIQSGTTWPQNRKFTAFDGAANDQFGVAVASDGSTVLIGARGANVIGNADQGAAYTFLPGPVSGDELHLKLSGSGGVEDYFGQSVALSDNGQIALIGAPAADVDGVLQQGAAFVFTRSGSTWKQLARLSALDGGVSDFFGQSVALSGDGNIALVGAPWKNGSLGDEQGAAYMFTHTGVAWSPTNWSQVRKLTDPESAVDDEFGSSVALSDDGNTAVVGAPNATILGKAKCGYVDFFHFNPTVAPEGFTGTVAGELFGQAVALSGDGLTALIGRPGATTEGDAKRGGADVYKFYGQNWAKQTTLHSTYGAANDGFGAQLALSDNGNVALVGVPLREVSGNVDQGAAYVFTRTGNTWLASYSLYVSTGSAGDHFGSSVALSAGGEIALIGAEGVSSGRAYSFTRNGNTWTLRRTLAGQDGDSNSQYGSAAALNDNGWMGLIGAVNGGGYGQGATYVVSNPVGTQFYVPMVKK